jgi:hypothetical protein
VGARRAAATIALLICIVCVAPAARADQTYHVEGSDVFQVGGRDERSVIDYIGTQRLSIVQVGKTRKFIARAHYLRNDQGTHARVTASFESTLLPNGEQHDGPNNDPDYLTVLNQPFAVQLDAATLHDLAHLSGAVPFDFPSPMTGAPLHGTLRHIGNSNLNGQPVLGVAFDASGPLDGALPDRPGLVLAGSIRMNGTAYYTDAGALLMALDATLSISGNVTDDARRDPVEIVYKRSIKAVRAERPDPAPHPTAATNP